MDTQDNLNHLELDDDCSADKLVFNLDFNAELSVMRAIPHFHPWRSSGTDSVTL